MKDKQKKPCGIDRCSTIFIVNGEAGDEREHCPYEEAIWKEAEIDKTIPIPATKRIRIHGKNLPNIRIMESDSESIVARLHGKYNTPGSELHFDCKPSMCRNGDSQKAEVELQLKCDTLICPAFAGNLILDVTIPRNYDLELVAAFGNSIIAELPSVKLTSLCLGASADVCFDISALNVNVQSVQGNITGTLTSHGDTNTQICADTGNIELSIKGFSQFLASLSSTSTEYDPKLDDANEQSERRLMGRISANIGTVTVK